MIDIKTQLTVKHYDGSTYADYSNKSVNFGRDSFTLTLAVADKILVGFRKPINAIYFDHLTTYTDELELVAEYYDGSAWVAISGLVDETYGLKRSGFVSFDRDQVNQVLSDIDGNSLFWYSFSLPAERADMVLSGINLVFADDNDLLVEQPYINTAEFLGSLNSHILTHVAVRNDIIQKFRGKDYVKVNVNGDIEDINIWDLLNIHEVKQAAIYLSLSKIYFNSSDASDDIWSIKSKDYYSRYEQMIQTASLSLDVNDDGLKQKVEVKNGASMRYMSR